MTTAIRLWHPCYLGCPDPYNCERAIKSGAQPPMEERCPEHRERYHGSLGNQPDQLGWVEKIPCRVWGREHTLHNDGMGTVWTLVLDDEEDDDGDA